MVEFYTDIRGVKWLYTTFCLCFFAKFSQQNSFFQSGYLCLPTP